MIASISELKVVQDKVVSYLPALQGVYGCSDERSKNVDGEYGRE